MKALEPQIENHIRQLPDFLVNQIKAGEVIEKPAFMIKELLENAIDARSTKIKLEIINNGLELFSIKDNGTGIPKKDLHLAFQRHATSKISQYQDLYQLHTYGFRGEALASISAMAKVQCYTVNNEDKSFIEIHENEVIHQESVQADPVTDESGTEILVKNLFYNTPVRLKFLKSHLKEKRSIQQIIDSYLVCHPHIEFEIKWDQKEKLSYPIESKLSRWLRILSLNTEKKVPYYFIEKKYDDYNLEFIYADTKEFSLKSKQVIIINDRPIELKNISYTLMRALPDSILKEGKLQSFILKLKVPPHHIDVNVNPNKTSIKLFEENKVLSFIFSSIESFLKTNHGKLYDCENRALQESAPGSIEDPFSINTSFQLQETSSNFSFSFKNGLIFYYENSLNYFNFKVFWKIFHPKILEEIIASGATPFLISKTISRNLSETDRTFLTSFHFEIEPSPNNEEQFLIRTFPSSPIFFSPLSLFDFLLQNKESIESKNNESLNYEMLVKDLNVNEVIKKYNFNELSDDGIILPVREEFFNTEKPSYLQ